MKRFIAILPIFLFLLFSINEVNIFAQTDSKTLTQGIYKARDTNLLIGNPITIKLTSSNGKAMVMIIDSDLDIRELVKLGPQYTEHVLKPLDYDSSIIIFGSGSIIFS